MGPALVKGQGSNQGYNQGLLSGRALREASEPVRRRQADLMWVHILHDLSYMSLLHACTFKFPDLCV